MTEFLCGVESGAVAKLPMMLAVVPGEYNAPYRLMEIVRPKTEQGQVPGKVVAEVAD
jgi:hypothetical protein